MSKYNLLILFIIFFSLTHCEDALCNDPNSTYDGSDILGTYCSCDIGYKEFNNSCIDPDTPIIDTVDWYSEHVDIIIDVANTTSNNYIRSQIEIRNDYLTGRQLNYLLFKTSNQHYTLYFGNTLGRKYLIIPKGSFESVSGLKSQAYLAVKP
ncbi:MAG: hypothetical protein OEZ36_09185 [Spirochaetota bacterium]|nr:hypothetical protein [Spirochaetota bacterium]